MKRTKFTESQIIGILKEQEQGKKMVDICREQGISQPTFYQWKSKYSGMDVNQLRRVKELEAELAQYKRMVAEQALDIRILKDLNSKKF
ncbi:MAG TPA: transposase [Cyclobacteriaceae bacterium]|nr:transposase [Cyclobacteriaceae bacterium]